MFELIFSALAAEFIDCNARRIIDDKVGTSDNPCRLNQARPVIVAEISCAQKLGNAVFPMDGRAAIRIRSEG